MVEIKQKCAKSRSQQSPSACYSARMTELQDQIVADIRGWDAIEDHRTGTEGDAATSEWLAGLARDAGGTPQVQAFPFNRWVLGNCAVAVNGRGADGVPLFDGGITGPAGVEGTLASLADGDAGIGIGRIGNAAPPGANERFARARATGNCAALVAVAAMDADVPGLALQNADRFVDPFGPPVLQVASQEGNWLLNAAARGVSASVVVDVALEPATASNVVVRIAGRDPSFAPMVVMTPKSAWWTCTAERGGGIVIWLALLRHFATNPPRRTVVFTANTGHELGHTGLDHFLQETPALAKAAHVWIHLGANFVAKDSERRLQTSDAGLQALAEQSMGAHDVPPQSIRAPGLRPFGEARNIYDAGGRYLSWLGSNRWFHHPTDRWPDTIDLDAANRMTNAMLEIASTIAND